MRLLPASAGAVADNVLQTSRSRVELTFRASVLFQCILVQFPHPTCFDDESYFDLLTWISKKVLKVMSIGVEICLTPA
jgi:hypothetical protein